MSSSPATIYSDMTHAVGGFLLTVARRSMDDKYIYIYYIHISVALL